MTIKNTLRNGNKYLKKRKKYKISKETIKQ